MSTGTRRRRVLNGSCPRRVGPTKCSAWIQGGATFLGLCSYRDSMMGSADVDVRRTAGRETGATLRSYLGGEPCSHHTHRQPLKPACSGLRMMYSIALQLLHSESGSRNIPVARAHPYAQECGWPFLPCTISNSAREQPIFLQATSEAQRARGSASCTRQSADISSRPSNGAQSP